MEKKNPVHIVFGAAARQGMAAGAELAARAIGATFGPQGGLVLLEKAFGNIAATSDGVTVAREVQPGAGTLASLGAHMVREACLKVEEEAGDGTTTTAIMAFRALQLGNKMVAAGFCPVELKREMDEARDCALAILRELSRPVTSEDMVRRVAFIASNGDEEVAAALAKGCMAAGSNGTVSVEDGVSTGIEIETKEGLEIQSGFVSDSFASDGLERVIDSPLVAIINKGLERVEDVQAILEEASQWPNNHLLLFSPYVEGQAKVTMVMNHKKGVVQSCAVNVPGMHNWKLEYMKDIAAISGATIVDEAAGMTFQGSFNAEWFGSVKKAVVTSKKTVLESFDEAGEGITERVQELTALLEGSTSDYDRDRYSENRAALDGGLVILRVGGVTEGAMKERRGRIEDALGAVRGAIEDGVVPGAGNGLLVAGQIVAMDANGRKGWEIVAEALKAPFKVLAEKGDVHGAVAELHTEAVDLWDFEGWDPVAQETRNLMDSPTLIDPTRMAISATSAAISVAGTLLTAEAALVGVRS
jgi:chaperonin GroEL